MLYLLSRSQIFRLLHLGLHQSIVEPKLRGLEQETLGRLQALSYLILEVTWSKVNTMPYSSCSK